jgi:phosphoheptose isomerase
MSSKFTLIRNPGVEAEAQRFANDLVEKYKKERAAYPHLDSISIDYMDGYPTDEVLERVTAILSNRWSLMARQFEATSGRAGHIVVTPKFNFT